MEVDFEVNKVFDENYLYFYAPRDKKRTKKEANFIEKALKLNKSKRILDLACGYGRHAIELAKRGYKIVGLDQSKLFLNIANKKSKGLKIKFLQGDMRKIPFKGEFDFAYNFFTSFGYFSDEDNFKVLKQVHGCLKPKGKFLLETINREYIIRNPRPYMVIENKKDSMTDNSKFDVLTGRINTRRIVVRNGQKKEFTPHQDPGAGFTFFIRLYTYTEIKELFKKAGFKILKVFGGTDGQEYTLDSPRMIILTEGVRYQKLT